MASPSQTRQWLLSNKPLDHPTLEGSSPTFKQVDTTLPALKDNQILVQVLYLSNDPAQRGWISKAIPPERLYVPPVQEGDVMRARALGRIVESNSADPKLAKGAHVLGTTGWTEYAVLDAGAVTPVPEMPGVGLTHFLGALGTTGLTAYYGLLEIAKAGAEDVVLVSGAAGATGSMVVQIAKGMVGCKRVIGLAGSDSKCRWVESLGADVCLNYKMAGFKEELTKVTERKVSVFFDNVGGEILDMMLSNMVRHGRIAQCGAISNYNKESSPTGIQNYFEVVSNRLNIQGFIVLDYIHKAGEVTQKFTAAIKDGKIKLTDDMETVVDTKFEDVPKTWMRLFEGANQGKLITKLV